MNLLLVGNFSALNPFVMETWSNPELLSINQNMLGVAAVKLNATTTNTPTTTTISAAADAAAHMAECGGEPANQQWAHDAKTGEISLQGKGKLCLNVDGCATKIIYDSCTKAGGAKTCGPNEKFTFKEKQLLSALHGGTMCVTETKTSGDLSLAKCSIISKEQTFQLSAATKQLTDGAGNCLTAAAPPPPGPGPAGAASIFIGRPLSADKETGAATVAAKLRGGAYVAKAGFALMLINNSVKDLASTCGAACLAGLGVSAAKGYAVRDVRT